MRIHIILFCKIIIFEYNSLRKRKGDENYNLSCNLKNFELILRDYAKEDFEKTNLCKSVMEKLKEFSLN